jgi:hypothetical protein
MKIFEAKLSDLSKIITYVTVAVLVVPATLMSSMAMNGDSEVLIPLAIVFIVLLVASLFRVKSYTLDATELRIQRPVGEAILSRADLRSATPVGTKDLGFGLRLFGSGGFAGYTGIFFYRNIGRVTLYATDARKFILLRTHEDKQYLVSPVDTAGFLKDLNIPVESLD